MAQLAEPLYCSEQIAIPPMFPYLLRQFAKAAIRTQPTDLLKWSTAYFRCLALNIPPPVKPRLEYPIPRDYCGITPGWLKALLFQLQGNETVSFKVLWDRWLGACLNYKTLIEILCLGRFNDQSAVPWLKFIGLCTGHLTNSLTETMLLVCEILTEEPEGGSSMIPVETFIDIYLFLSKIDASQPQAIKNIHFIVSSLELYERKPIKTTPDEGRIDKLVLQESTSESIKSTVIEEEEGSLKTISCPSLSTANSEKSTSEDETNGVEKQDIVIINEPNSTDLLRVVMEDEEEPLKKPEQENFVGDLVSEKDSIEPNGNQEQVVDILVVEEDSIEREESKEEPEGLVDVLVIEEDSIEPEESKDELEQIEDVILLKDDSKEFKEEQELKVAELETHDRKSIDQELPGETDEEVENFKCGIIDDTPLAKSDEILLQRTIPVTLEEKTKLQGTKILDAKSEEEVYTGEPFEKQDEIYVQAIPGIGPIVSDSIIKSLCSFLRKVAKNQEGMIMPRNLTHFTCPFLEDTQFLSDQI